MKMFMKNSFGLAMIVIAVALVLTGVGAPLGLCLAFAGVTTTDMTDGQVGMQALRIGKDGTIRKRFTIPLAKQVASDVLQLLAVKAGWLVKQVHIIMVTPTTGDALTANFGDDGAAAGFDAAMSLKGAAGTRTYGIDGTDAYITSAGRYYPAANTIDLAFVTVTNPAGDVVFDLIAEVKDFSV
jgi:hypothetical protein